MLSFTVRRAEFPCAYEARSVITKSLRWTVSWETYIQSFHSVSQTSFNIILKHTLGPFGSGLLCFDKWFNFTDILARLDGPIIIIVIIIVVVASYLSRWMLEISWKMYDFSFSLCVLHVRPISPSSVCQPRVSFTEIFDWHEHSNITNEWLSATHNTVLWSNLCVQSEMSGCGRKESRSF